MVCGSGIPSAEGLRRPLMASYVYFATSRPRQRGARLSSGPLCYLIILLRLSPCKAYVVQARRPAIRNIRHQVPPVYIMDIKSVVTQKALKIFCETFHIPDDVHPELPSPNQTIHEMPTGKIGVYTRFFEYTNFRLPLSNFLVNVLKHYHIHISQPSVIAAAKVSHFEIMCRVHGFEPKVGLFHCFYVNSTNKGWLSHSKHQGNDVVCYTKPIDSLKGWNDHFFWVDAFACPASFSWHTSKSVSEDPFPKSSEFNAEHYATLVAYPASFHKYPKPFLCLVGMSRHFTLDENTYPEFLHDNDEEIDLLSFIRTVDPTKVRIGERQRAKNEPKLFDTTVGRVVPLLPVALDRAESELEASVDKLFDEGGSGNPGEQGDSASGGQGVGIQLVCKVAEIVVEDVAPLQPRRQKKQKTTIVDAGKPSHPAKRLRDDQGTLGGASVGGKSMSVVQRLLAGAVQNAEVRGEVIPTLPFVTSSVSATPGHEGEEHTDSVAGTNLRTVGPPQRFVISLDSSHHSSANVAKAEVDSVVSGIRTVISFDTDLQKVMKHDQLFTEFNVGAARQMSLSAKVRMSGMGRLKISRRSCYGKEAKAAEAIHLRAEASKLEAVKKSLQDEVQAVKECNATLEKEKNDLDVKVADLAASVKVKEYEVAGLDAMVTSVKSQNDNLVDQVHELETSSTRLQEEVTVFEDCMG
ncbi:hypothetical protein Tco_1308905 [Tanacetum coccineum]